MIQNPVVSGSSGGGPWKEISQAEFEATAFDGKEFLIILYPPEFPGEVGLPLIWNNYVRYGQNGETMVEIQDSSGDFYATYGVYGDGYVGNIEVSLGDSIVAKIYPSFESPEGWSVRYFVFSTDKVDKLFTIRNSSPYSFPEKAKAGEIVSGYMQSISITTKIMAENGIEIPSITSYSPIVARAPEGEYRYFVMPAQNVVITQS